MNDPRARLAEMLPSFGIAALRPGQERAALGVLAGRDVLVVLPTGGGKSLCYQLPAAAGLAPTIVVSPLVALMKDQVDALRRRGVAAAQLSGAVSASEREAAWQALAAGALTLLYVAPEALASSETRGRLAQLRPRLLAVDEAHCISEWGESFRPSYLSLGEVRRALGQPPTMALTATATPRTAREIVARLDLRDPVLVTGGFDRANLRLRVDAVATEGERLTRLLQHVRARPGPTVCYAPTRREAERLASAVRRVGVPAAPFHAGLPTSERGRLQEDFQANRLAVIVATNAFGMGVDKPDVRLVLHAAPPRTLEAYYQEAGRAGRDGAIADCLLLHAPNDLARIRRQLAGRDVSAPLLRRLLALLRQAASVPLSAVWGGGAATASPETAAMRALAHGLGASVDEVSVAVRLLIEEGALATAPRRGALRLISTPGRVRQVLAAAGHSSGMLRGWDALEASLSSRDGSGEVTTEHLERLAPDVDVRELLRTFEHNQLGVWRPTGLPWRVAADPNDEALQRLATRHALRRARDRWRFEHVARMVTGVRCRRTVLLRYFGDPVPAAPCGACDRCGIPPLPGSAR